jgi:hypothetical protein
MALTIEDGTGVAGANSYVTLAEARTYATDRGLSLPADDAALSVLLIKAWEYIDMEPRGSYKGNKTYLTSDTAKWPRTDVMVDGVTYASNEVPAVVKKAQIQAAVDIQTTDPTPILAGNLIKRKKVDVIETEYAIDYKAGQKPPTLTKVDMLLQPFLRYSSLRVVRV